MKDVLDNPAARLLQALSDLREASPNEPANRVLSQLVGPGSDKTPANQARRIAFLLNLPDDVVREVKATEEIISHQVLLRWRGPIEGAFARVLEGHPVGEVITRYSDGDLVALEVCADYLHRYRREPILSEDKLDEISAMVHELLGILEEDSELDVELRDLLLTHTQAMIRAIDEIPVRGYVGLQEATAQTIGMLQIRFDLAARQNTSPRTWDKVAAVLTAAAAAFTFATAGMQALEAAPPPPPIVVVETLPVPAPAITPGIIEAQQVSVLPQGLSQVESK